ncbi:MAG: anti-sigma factor [Mycobacteriales bacterium]|nr:hypothetical protein [Frankia sp.]
MTTNRPTEQVVPAACAAVRLDLPGLDGHELTTRRVTELRDHLAGCVECSELAASYRAVRRTLAELHDMPVAPPPALLDSLLDRVSAPGVRERAAVLGRGAISGARPKVVAAGAGIGALAAAGLGFAAWRVVRARRSAAAA